MVTVRLCWRLARGGGRAGLTRLLLMVLGVTLGVASLAVAASLPSVVDARIHRAAARLALRADSPDQASFRYSQTDDTVNDRPWLHASIAADPRNPTPAGPVVPPGLARLPRPGETFASPALIEAARTSPGLAARLGPVAGVIGPAGLQGPDEAVSYTGVARDYIDPSNQGSVFGGSTRDVDVPASPGKLAVELVLLAGGPALLFLVTCSRLSAATRARRLAALRLVGMSRRQLLAVAGLEAAVTGALGCGLGLGLHALVAPVLGSSGILGIGWYPADSAVGPVTSAVVVAGVAALSARFGSLGVSRVLADATAVRHGEDRRRDSLWRLPPVLVGTTALLVFAVSTAGHSDRIYLPDTVNIVVVAMALAVLGLLLAIGPFCRLLARVVAGRTRSLAVRLGARRVQYESGSLVRVVTGLVLLVLVAGLGQAILRSAALAAGAEAETQRLQVELDEATPAARTRLMAVPALARVAMLPVGAAAEPTAPSGGTEPSPSQPSTEQGSTGQGEGAVGGDPNRPDPRYAGMAVYYVTCSDLRTMLREPVPACQDGHSYRLDDADPATPPSQVTAGMSLPVPAAGGRTATLTAPRDILTVPSLAQALPWEPAACSSPASGPRPAAGPSAPSSPTSSAPPAKTWPGCGPGWTPWPPACNRCRATTSRRWRPSGSTAARSTSA